jgi:hypothetical protein
VEIEGTKLQELFLYSSELETFSLLMNMGKKTKRFIVTMVEYQRADKVWSEIYQDIFLLLT